MTDYKVKLVDTFGPYVLATLRRATFKMRYEFIEPRAKPTLISKKILRPTVCATRKGSVTSTQKLFIIQYWSSRFLSTPLPIFLSYSCPFSDNRVRIRRGVIYLGLVCVILILIKYFDCPYVVHFKGFFPSSIYSCSIGHILEYEICHLGCWAVIKNFWNDGISATFLGVFFNFLVAL